MLSLGLQSTSVCGGDTIQGYATLDILKPVQDFLGVEIILFGKERTNLSKSIHTIPPPHTEGTSAAQHSAVFNISKIIQVGDSHTFLEMPIILFPDQMMDRKKVNTSYPFVNMYHCIITKIYFKKGSNYFTFWKIFTSLSNSTT